MVKDEQLPTAHVTHIVFDPRRNNNMEQQRQIIEKMELKPIMPRFRKVWSFKNCNRIEVFTTLIFYTAKHQCCYVNRIHLSEGYEFEYVNWLQSDDYHPAAHTRGVDPGDPDPPQSP
ncbi:hypothetical protein TNCV_1834251 [Trichonephila clavipes]|nr:hypothetical protein TNCV_1834251 [Trichonephila clavipes]